MNCFKHGCRRKAKIELPYEQGAYCDQHKKDGWISFSQNWEAFQKDPTCGNCGKPANPDLMFMGDPYISELYPEDDSGCQNWCDSCYEARREEI